MSDLGTLFIVCVALSAFSFAVHFQSMWVFLGVLGALMALNASMAMVTERLERR